MKDNIQGKIKKDFINNSKYYGKLNLHETSKDSGLIKIKGSDDELIKNSLIKVPAMTPFVAVSHDGYDLLGKKMAETFDREIQTFLERHEISLDELFVVVRDTIVTGDYATPHSEEYIAILFVGYYIHRKNKNEQLV